MTDADIIAALATAPDGMTYKTIAQQLSVNPRALGMKLSRMATYGKIKRTIIRGGRGQPQHFYSAKEPAS